MLSNSLISLVFMFVSAECVGIFCVFTYWQDYKGGSVFLVDGSEDESESTVSKT